MPESPTLRDVAAYVGMGKSTVQRVLTGVGSVSPEAHKQIMEAVAKLGYRPNPLFSILGSQKHRHSMDPMKIAYIYRATCQAGVNYFPGAEARGKMLGYDVELVELAEFAAEKRLMDIFYHRGYAGVIVGQVPASDGAAILANTHLPVVSCGRISPLPLHTIQTDTTDLIRLAWSSILKAGYSRIGVALAPHVPVVEDDFDRFATVLQCQADTLAVKDRIPPLRAPLRDHNALIIWFHKYKPDAVLAFGTSLYYPLRDSGVDMSRIGFASLHNSVLSPEFAGMIEPLDSISREAVNFLDQLIRHRAVGTPEERLHLLVPGRWHDGDSLPPKQPLPAIKSKAKAKRREKMR
jgi:LacI family transcriptional regulator